MSRVIVDIGSDVSGVCCSRDGLVVLAGVEFRVAERVAFEVEGSDVEAGDEHDDVPALVGGADADVVEPAFVAQGDGAGFGDFVVADSVAGDVYEGAAWSGFFAGGVRGGGCLPVDAAVGSDVVVV